MKQIIWIAMTQTEHGDRQLAAFSTEIEGNKHIEKFIERESTIAKLNPYNIPDFKPEGWSPEEDAEYVLVNINNKFSVDQVEIELPVPTTKVWSLALDGANMGTQTLLFYSEQEFNDFMWENCVDDYETSIKALQEKYDYDYYDAMKDGHEIEGLTYDVDVHEVPIAATAEGWAQAELERVRDRANDLETSLAWASPYIKEWVDMFDPSDEADKEVKAARDECRKGYAHIIELVGTEDGS